MEYIKNLDWLALADKLVMPVCILVVSLLVGIFLNGKLQDKLAERVQNDDASRVKNIFFHALQGLPISMCLIIGLYWIVNTSSYLPEGLVRIFSYLLFAVVVITLTRVIEKTLSGFISWKIEASGGETASSSLLHTIFKTLIYASAALIILQEFGISIAPIITAMGVGGMAVAFGVQETVANIFSGLHIILTRQVKINDFIKLSSGEEGRVTDISLRFTTITPAADGSTIVIPNKNIAGAVITNFSRPRDDVGIVIPIGVGYESDLDLVERVTLEVAKDVQRRFDEYDPNDAESKLHPAVLYQEFGESSINFWAVLHASVYTKQLKIKHEFIKEITRRYREENINIPFPIRTVLMPEEVNTNKINFSK
ncbi:MAG: mechanosensitive ion channel [Selenomonadaceae bacterium]|nr:mechanosensitive ion channel [Selenomonadaceae bacterium]